MQAVNKSGVYAKIEEFNSEKLEAYLQNPNIDHVEVFNSTKENIRKRNKLVGKKYKISKGYKKAPRVRK